MPKDTGLRGFYHVLGSVDGLKRYLDLTPSRYHVMNFCQGTVAEMCADPATEVLDVIRYFGGRKKIFMVHFRNITAATSISMRSIRTTATWTCTRRSGSTKRLATMA